MILVNVLLGFSHFLRNPYYEPTTVVHDTVCGISYKPNCYMNIYNNIWIRSHDVMMTSLFLQQLSPSFSTRVSSD